MVNISSCLDYIKPQMPGSASHLPQAREYRLAGSNRFERGGKTG